MTTKAFKLLYAHIGDVKCVQEYNKRALLNAGLAYGVLTG